MYGIIPAGLVNKNEVFEQKKPLLLTKRPKSLRISLDYEKLHSSKMALHEWKSALTLLRLM